MKNLKKQITEDLKSGEPDTNMFGSDSLLMVLYASRREANSLWDQIYDIGIENGLCITQTDGDDNITLYEIGADGTVNEDLIRTADLQANKYGLLKEDPTRKGELGYFYTQFRLTYDGRFITPISRMNFYYKESSTGALPMYTYAMTLWQQLEYRWDAKGIDAFIHRFILPYDESKLGTHDVITGKQLTLGQFRNKLKLEAEENGMTTTEMIFKGNPYHERMMDKDNRISGE